MQLESFDNNNTHALSCFPEIIIHCFYYFGEFEPFDRLFYIVILYIYCQTSFEKLREGNPKYRLSGSTLFGSRVQLVIPHCGEKTNILHGLTLGAYNLQLIQRLSC